MNLKIWNTKSWCVLYVVGKSRCLTIHWPFKADFDCMCDVFRTRMVNQRGTIVLNCQNSTKVKLPLHFRSVNQYVKTGDKFVMGESQEKQLYCIWIVFYKCKSQQKYLLILIVLNKCKLQAVKHVQLFPALASLVLLCSSPLVLHLLNILTMLLTPLASRRRFVQEAVQL